MDEIKARLDQAIEKKTERFMACYDAFGVSDQQTIRAHAELEGMKEAFEIVTGERHFEYWCRKMGV